MEEKIVCRTHLEEYAQYYCEECSQFICPHCALSNKHFNHINKVKTNEDIIKQKIKVIDDLDNFSLYKTAELFKFIVNYNSFAFPYDKNYIISLINEQFDAYIGKLIELKMKIINLFSEKFEINSNILKSTKNTVLEAQQKLLLKINNNENKNDYLNKLNICLEKIRLNKDPNEAINFMNDYENLINECFENEDDLNKKYNFYLSYKYLNDSSVSFKGKTFDRIIQPFFKKSLNQIENIINQVKEEEKIENEKIKSKLNEINAEIHFKKENKRKNAEEIINNEINNVDNIQDEIISNNINENDKSQKEILKENQIEKKDENIQKENLIEENIVLEQIEENNLEEIKKEENNINEIENQKNEEEIKENELKEKEVEEKEEDIKRKLEDKLKKDNIEKKDNTSLIFEPPIIEGGIMTLEEINNIKEDEEEKFLKNEFDDEEKDINTNLMENNMIEM